MVAGRNVAADIYDALTMLQHRGLRAIVPKEEQGLINQAVLMDPVDWVAEWVGANFERVLEAEPTEAVKETLDSTEML